MKTSAAVVFFLSVSYACSRSSSPTPADPGGGAAGAAGEGGASGGQAGASSTTGGQSGAGGQTATIDDLPEEIRVFCSEMEAYTCDYFEHCNGAICGTDGLPPPANLRRFCEESLPELWAAGLYTFDAELAQDCLPKTPLCVQRWADIFDTLDCRGVFQGTIPAGEPCNPGGWLIGDSCLDGYCGGETCPKTCISEAGEGESCASVSCGPGLRCLDGTCVEIPDLGQPCVDSCLGSLICMDTGDGKRCGAGAGDGESCSDQVPCTSAFVCSEGTCTLSVTSGSVCTQSRQCPDGEICLAKEGETTPTCQAPLGLGEPCASERYCKDSDSGKVTCADPDPVGGDEATVCVRLGAADDPCEPLGCQGDYWCYYPPPGNREDGVCKPPGGLGDSCESAEGPRSSWGNRCLLADEPLHCIDGTCSSAAAIGEKCRPDDAGSCREGWCSSVTGLCEKSVKLGSDCNPYWFLDSCEEGAFCPCPDDACRPMDTGTCTALKLKTALCNQDEECRSGYCDYAQEPARCADRPEECPAISY